MENNNQLRTLANKDVQYLNIVEYGADNTGQTDASADIISAFAAGYKHIYFPPGEYLFNSKETVTIPIGGSIVGSQGLNDGVNTVTKNNTTYSVDIDNLTWFKIKQYESPIKMQHNSEIKGIIFEYPDQNCDYTVTPPYTEKENNTPHSICQPTITGVGSLKSAIIRECCFKNSHTAISFTDTNGQIYIERNVGFPLNGIVIKKQADKSYIVENHFARTFARYDNLNLDQTHEDIDDYSSETCEYYVANTGVAYDIQRADWSEIRSFAYGYNIGFKLYKSEDTLLIGCGADGCRTGVILKNVCRVKMIGCTVTGFKGYNKSADEGTCVQIFDENRDAYRNVTSISDCTFFCSRRAAINAYNTENCIIQNCSFIDVVQASDQNNFLSAITLSNVQNFTLDTLFFNNNELTYPATPDYTHRDAISVSANCNNIKISNLNVACDLNTTPNTFNFRYLVRAQDGSTGVAQLYGFPSSAYRIDGSGFIVNP